MDYQLRIPEPYPMREHLEKAITELLAFVEAGTIYISNNKDDNVPIIITFILKKNCGQCGDRLQEISKKITKSYPDFIFRFINAFRASHGFKAGLPYLIRNCTINELVYYEQDSKLFYPVNFNPKKLIKKAKLSFNGDKQATLESFKASLTHIKNNQNFEAAIAMYMAFWSLYSCYSGFLIGELGEDMEYPNFLEEYKRVTAFVPHLKNILDYDAPQDKEIIISLITANKSKTLNIPMEDVSWAVLERAKQKFELLSTELDRRFKLYTKYCKQKKREFSNLSFLGKSIFTTKIKSNYIMDLALFEISNLIANFFKTRAVYCFGYTIIDGQEEKKENYSKKLPRYHFYLLVLNLEYKDNAVSLLQSLIHEKFQGRYEVTILSHRANYLGKQSQNQKYFFDSIMRNGLLTYNNPLYPIYSKTFDVARDLKFSQNYWQNRILAAEHFLILVQDSNEPEVPLIINSILQESVKQIAVGLLDLFLGYHPNRHSIKHLFSLLLYLDIIELPFDLNNEKEKFLFQLLSANSNMIMHKDLKRESAQDSDILFDKCEKFFELAEEIGNKEIKRIESLNNDEPQRQEYVS